MSAKKLAPLPPLPRHSGGRLDPRRELTARILRFLNREQIRATYGAVGDLLGIPTQSVGDYLETPRIETSWVVTKSSKVPSLRAGYKPSEIHPALKNNPHVIDTAGELRRRLAHRPG